MQFKKLSLSSFTRRQLLTLVVFGIADFCNAICVSLQAPFYPMEAEKKGCSATEYGLVFGIFELVVFIVSPIYGKHLNQIGPKVLFNGGIFVTGVCAMLFGFLDKVDDHYVFITLSFVIRIVEALGNAAFLTASFAIIAMEFPENVATTFASLETCFGLGLIVGPVVGGGLYVVGGYITPFIALGSFLFLTGIMTSYVLPEHKELETVPSRSKGLLQVVKVPGVFVASASIVVTSMSIGFLSATLEPHLRKYELSPFTLGAMFMINGGTYAISAPCIGWLCDSKINPKVAALFGCIFLITGFSFIGPAPYIPFDSSLSVIIFGLFLHGFGIAACLVSSFTDALRTSINAGFPNNLETYGLISGLWTSTFALGAFLGPSLSGFLYDSYGFNNASLLIVILGLTLTIVIIIFIYVTRPRSMYQEIGKNYESLSNETGASTPISFRSSRSATPSTSVPFERPPGMSGIITCNSYKNRHGDWHRRDCNAISPSSYSASSQRQYYSDTCV